MRVFLIVLFIFSLISFCYADRVCLEKSTGKLIEYQSGGSTQADLDVMVQNAVNGGYKKEDVEVKYITPKEWKIIEEEQIRKPAREAALLKKQQDEIEQQKVEEEAKQALNLTDEQFNKLKKALKN